MNNAPPRSDFPSWLPPTLVKELRQGMRTPAFLIMMCAFPILIALGFTLVFVGEMLTQDLIDMDIIKFIGFKGALVLSLLLIQPIRAMSGIREEVDSKTVDLLSLTRLSARRIVLGKWLSLMFQSLLLVFACLPFLFVMYFFGNVNLAEELYSLIFIIAAGGLMTAYALWVSAYSALLRGLFGFALIWLSIMVIVISANSSVLTSPLNWEQWIYLAIMLAEGALATLLFLLMAAKRIAPAADNLSASIRKWTLLGLPWGTLLALCFQWKSVTNDDFFMTLSWINLGLAFFVLLIESLDPDTTIRRHLSGKNGKKASFFRRIFLLPDQKSSLAFLFLYMGLSLPALYLLTRDWTYNGAVPNALLMPWIAGTITYSIFITSILLGPFRKNLKSGVFFLAAALFGLGSLLASIVCKIGIPIMAAMIPWGCIFIPDMFEAKTEPGACMVGFLLSMLLMTVSFFLMKKRRAKFTPPPPAKPDSAPSSPSSES